MLAQVTTAEARHHTPVRPAAQPSSGEVREQLQNILKSPLFKTSKRYPSVLRYIVERALDGSNEVLKERTIGFEVLGRDPDYDTNQDPTVRVVAGEVRKRLQAYYLEPAHAHELRIELPIGSYTPRFVAAVEPEVELEPKHRNNWRWALGSAFILVAVLVVWRAAYPPVTALDKFWAPVLRGTQPILLCVGQQTAWGSQPRLEDPMEKQSGPPLTLPAEIAQDNTMRRFFSAQPVFTLLTMTAMTRIAAFLRPKTSEELIRASSATSLADLRPQPAVLIGSYSNYWTMHFGEELRFRFRRENLEGMNWIEDRDNPSKKSWAVKVNAPYTEVTKDFGIITRVTDASTGQILVAAGGVTAIGTLAASEFLVNPAGWQTIAQQAPKNWEHKNLQIVIAVTVVNGNAGSPTVLATYFW